MKVQIVCLLVWRGQFSEYWQMTVLEAKRGTVVKQLEVRGWFTTRCCSGKWHSRATTGLIAFIWWEFSERVWKDNGVCQHFRPSGLSSARCNLSSLSITVYQIFFFKYANVSCEFDREWLIKSCFCKVLRMLQSRLLWVQPIEWLTLNFASCVTRRARLFYISWIRCSWVLCTRYQVMVHTW